MLPHFCSSIALATRDGEPLLGVIYDPPRRELFTAIHGGGTRLNGRPVAVTQTAELVDAVITSGFPYDKHTIMPAEPTLRRTSAAGMW